MERKRGVLNHRAIASQGGHARAKSLTDTQRAEIARKAGRKSAVKRQDRNAVKKLKELAHFFKHRHMANGTDISLLLLLIASDLEKQEKKSS
jgi:hypothetical protein